MPPLQRPPLDYLAAFRDPVQSVRAFQMRELSCAYTEGGDILEELEAGGGVLNGEYFWGRVYGGYWSSEVV